MALNVEYITAYAKRAFPGSYWGDVYSVCYLVYRVRNLINHNYCNEGNYVWHGQIGPYVNCNTIN